VIDTGVEGVFSQLQSASCCFAAALPAAFAACRHGRRRLVGPPLPPAPASTRAGPRGAPQPNVPQEVYLGVPKPVKEAFRRLLELCTGALAECACIKDDLTATTTLVPVWSCEQIQF
jgi:hypothetical protein